MFGDVSSVHFCTLQILLRIQAKFDQHRWRMNRIQRCEILTDADTFRHPCRFNCFGRALIRRPQQRTNLGCIVGFADVQARRLDELPTLRKFQTCRFFFAHLLCFGFLHGVTTCGRKFVFVFVDDLTGTCRLLVFLVSCKF